MIIYLLCRSTMIDEKIQFSFDFPEQEETNFNDSGMFFITFKFNIIIKFLNLKKESQCTYLLLIYIKVKY